LPPLQGDILAELHRIEAALERLRGAIAPAPSTAPTVTPKQLRLMIKARRAREQMLGSQHFADPAWDILLEAYLAEMTQVRLSVSGLCQSSGVPVTTALRWVQKLEQDGWLAREDDPFDGRRTWIELTAAGSERLSRYFAALGPDALPI
jgi:DNA-binding MarR family transcriptional regulator